MLPTGATAVRAVFYLDISDVDVDAALDPIRDVVRETVAAS